MPLPMTSRRIVVIGPQFSGRDGLSEFSRQVVLALADGPQPVVVRSLADEAPPEQFEGPQINFVSVGRGAWRLAAAALNSADRRDLVVIMHAHLLPFALPALLRGARVAAMLIGIESWKELSWLHRAVLARSRVVAISQHTADRFRSANPYASRVPIAICHPAVPGSVPAGDAVVRPGFALMVGRMSAEERYKGHDAVLNAWPIVRASCPDARLVIAGDGDDRSRLEEKAGSAGMRDHVAFVGRVEPSALAALYRDACFFLMPSRDEGFGLVYLEAMRDALPCIASPGAAHEIFGESSAGLLVPHGDVHAIADACVRLFRDPALRVAMGQAGRQRVMSDFEFPAFVRRLRDAVGVGAGVAAC